MTATSSDSMTTDSDSGAMTATSSDPSQPAQTDMQTTAESGSTGADGNMTSDGTQTTVEGQALPTGSSDPAAQTDMQTTSDGTSAQTDTQTASQAETDATPEVMAASDPAEPVTADGQTEGDVQVTEETVTEETARDPNEDFATAVDENAPQSATAATTATTTASNDDDGLSDDAKKILGLGALAIGAAVLANQNREVVTNSGDRVVVRDDNGEFRVLKDDNAILRRPGSKVTTATYADGSTKQTITRADGTQIITVRDPEFRVLQRIRIQPDGERIVLFDDTQEVQPVDRLALRDAEMQPEVQSSADEAALRQALERNVNVDRTYSLRQVRDTAELRAIAPAISLDTVTFPTGSAAIGPDQVDALVKTGEVIKSAIADNPREVFLIEGHTDAVGDAAYNLALSDRRAETVALALTEYFDVPPENLVVQGYGEQFLKVETQTAEQANRRAVVRRITPLITASR
jgi:outer membrane protein OmpA-like peptidoglycan-associated protein